MQVFLRRERAGGYEAVSMRCAGRNTSRRARRAGRVLGWIRVARPSSTLGAHLRRARSRAGAARDGAVERGGVLLLRPESTQMMRIDGTVWLCLGAAFASACGSSEAPPRIEPRPDTAA